MSRRTFLIAALALLLAFAALAAAWHIAAAALAEGVARWTAERRAEGYRIAHGEPAIGGFPFALTLRLENPSIAAPAGLWRWRGPAVAGKASLWNPLAIRLSLAGRHEAAWATPEGPRAVLAEAARAEGTILLGREGRVRSADFAFADLVIAEAGDRLTAAAARLAATDAGSDGEGRPLIRFALESTGLLLPQKAEPPLGREIERLSASGRLIGRIPPGRPAVALAAWRDAGGYVDLTELTLAWGPLRIEGNGGFALDEAMQPEGAVGARVTGHLEALEALVEAGLVRPAEGAWARVAMALASGPDESLDLSFEIQDGKLGLGALPIAFDLPEIRWE